MATSLIDFVKWLVELVWKNDKTIARPATIVAIAVFLATLVKLAISKDDDGIGIFIVLFLVIVAVMVGIYLLPGASTSKVTDADGQLIAPTQPKTPTSRFVMAGNILLSLLFAIPQITNAIPEVGRVFDALGLQQLLSPSCLLRPLQDCGTVLKDISVTAAAPSQGSAQNSAATPAVPRDAYTVYIQFAGIPRDQIKTLATGLHASGWSVPSYAAGGEEIASAKGRMEVRYGNASDKTAADQLAAEISAAKVTAAPLATKLLPIVHKGVLEVWIGG